MRRPMKQWRQRLRPWALGVAVCCLVTLALSSGARVEAQSLSLGPEFVPGEILLKFHDDADGEAGIDEIEADEAAISRFISRSNRIRLLLLFGRRSIDSALRFTMVQLRAPAARDASPKKLQRLRRDSTR